MCIDRVTNSGTLVGDVILGFGNPNDADNRLTNSGRIDGDVFLGEGDNSFANSGKIFNDSGTGFGGSVTGGGGVDIVTNYILVKKAIAGGVKTVMKSGTVEGSFNLGGGDDIFKGGNNTEFVRDSGGEDNYRLGGGDDNFRAFFRNQGLPPDNTDKDDVVNGGKGIDTYDASLAISGSFGDPGAVINLDSKSHTFVYRGVNITIGANRGNDIESGNPNGFSTPGDKVLNFENVKGTGFDDVLIASNAVNELSGGGGADRFIFGNLKASGPTATTQDSVLDFSKSEGDKIDLSGLHAPGGAFHFIGTNVEFNSNDPGQVRAYWTGTGQIVELDVDGDKKADFSIELVDVNHNNTLASSDFFL